MLVNRVATHSIFGLVNAIFFGLIYRMDYSQYLRQKQEAANVYIARNKPVDSSFLTMQKQQLAAYSGSSHKNQAVYFNADPALRTTVYDSGSCPKNHLYTQGYTTTNPLAQQEVQANCKAGAILRCSPDYAESPAGMMLKSCTEVSTILASQANINTSTSASNPVYTKPYGMGSMPGQWVAHDYGQNHFFPKGDTPSPSTSCIVNKYLYSSG